MNLQNPRTIARVFGWLFVATFATSIPAYPSLFTGRYPMGMFDFVEASCGGVPVSGVRVRGGH